MKKVIILKGIPASGKSTYAKQLVKDNPGMYKRVNRDDLRMMLDQAHFSKSNEKFVKKLRNFIIEEALLAGKHIIVDDTNLSESNVEGIKELTKKHTEITGHPVKIEIKVFEISVEEAIKRDANRENPVGKAVIKRMDKQLNGFKKTKPVYRTQDENLPKAIICDLDGTLAIIGDRSPFDGSKCEFDLPNTPIVNMVKQYKNQGYKILLLSGRNGKYKPETIRWLEKYDVEYDALWMRSDKDMRKDSVMKKELFETHIENQFKVEFVLDDRDQVVDLWRNELNLPCLQVFYGDF